MPVHQDLAPNRILTPATIPLFVRRLILSVTIVVTPLYFLAGFTPAASDYFFYLFVVFLTCAVFLSSAMVCSAYFDSLAVSAVLMSSIIPLLSLFAGVYIPKPQARLPPLILGPQSPLSLACVGCAGRC